MMPQDKCSIAAYWNIFKIILKYEIWDPFDNTLGFNDPRLNRWYRFRFIVCNVTFNNISISWGSVLLLEETVVPGENH
jgi:hypothetical protein